MAAFKGFAVVCRNLHCQLPVAKPIRPEAVVQFVAHALEVGDIRKLTILREPMCVRGSLQFVVLIFGVEAGFLT